MSERLAGSDWDNGNRTKCQKHGVTIAEIEGLFEGEVAVLPDPRHSAAETRFLGLGRTPSGRHVFIAFTFRERSGVKYLRPISARFMHRKEVLHYEQANS
jgi:uncharacterized DUF497 family protein